jgi:outer membrane protein OmpA-like peptidoglycan-associated protein/tetratricopeptide (TPR) repeat protein
MINHQGSSKNKIMRKIILLYLIISSFSVFAQDNKLRKAEKYYLTANYSKAAEQFSILLNEEVKNPEILKKAADSYYFISNFEKANPLYKELIENFKESIDEKYIFRYAQSLKAVGNTEDSNKWMKVYESEMTETVYKATIEKLENIKSQGNKFEIKNVVINTPYSDFGPTVYNNQFVFSSPTKEKKIFSKKYKWNNQSYLDLYTTEIKDNKLDSIVKPFSETLNTKLHEASVAFSNDGKTIYFTRNNNEKGKRKKDAEKITHVSIYSAELIGNEWTNVKPLPFNGLTYSTMHPSLNKDNTKLYFSSDMPGTIGSFDIFYVDIDANGKFGKPINLGDQINTKNREQFPYISDENKLFFASDGHIGFGLLDVFLAEETKEGYSKPLNLGLPINTNMDDFSFIYNDNSKRGFFASNRQEGKGDDDIYSFLQISPLKDFQYFVQGTIIDSESEEPIEGAKIEMFDEKGNKIAESIVDKEGTFYFDLQPGTFKLATSHPDFIPAEKTFTVLDNGNSKTEQIIKMQRIPKTFLEELIAEEGEPKVITDDGVLMFDLPEILFDFDKFNIRDDAKVHLDKLVDKLSRYPQIDIAIGSHTDKRGTEAYNEKLSQDRATSTMNYLIEKGIDANRVTAKGYGESKPKVDCDDHECSDAEHQINRRSEFVIIVKKEE